VAKRLGFGMMREAPRQAPRWTPTQLPRVAETLWIRGAVPTGTRPVVAIVGARAASGHGRGRAAELASELTRRGMLVISGGALGIDSAAHQGALAAGGQTVAVVAALEPSGVPYPSRNRLLFDAIVDQGGAVVTPFPPGAPLARWQFVRRNRVIAALADAVVVVEASPASGSLHTASAARALGRVLGACPGTAGAAALIAQGAAMVESADDVAAALAGNPRRQAPALPPRGSDEALVLAALAPGAPAAAETVGEIAGIGARRAARALCLLEIEGLALAIPGGRYVRAPQLAPYLDEANPEDTRLDAR
jgi:DNA processing protein